MGRLWIMTAFPLILRGYYTALFVSNSDGRLCLSCAYIPVNGYAGGCSRVQAISQGNHGLEHVSVHRCSELATVGIGYSTHYIMLAMYWSINPFCLKSLCRVTKHGLISETLIYSTSMASCKSSSTSSYISYMFMTTTSES